jgi:hypothetical protein
MEDDAMKSLAIALSLSLSLPALAQDSPPTGGDDGFSLMEEGAKLIMRGMMAEMEPALDEMEKALGDMQPMLEEIGPQLAELMELIGDFRNYDSPVVLPNGDILIRRKAPLVPELHPGPNGEIEL